MIISMTAVTSSAAIDIPYVRLSFCKGLIGGDETRRSHAPVIKLLVYAIVCSFKKRSQLSARRDEERRKRTEVEMREGKKREECKMR